MWRPVPGHLHYQVSDTGEVYSERKGGLLKLRTRPDGYKTVKLGRENLRTVHTLVLEAFVGQRPNGAVTRHLDGNPANNHLSNLTWGTQSENAYDKVRHGRNHESLKTHCPRGHEYSAANTGRSTKGGRVCRTCARDKMRETRRNRT